MEEKIYSELAENIRFIRIQRGFSQEELAEKANVSASYIYKIEAGRVQIGLMALIKIKAALEIPFGELFGEDECSAKGRQDMKELLYTVKNAPRQEQILLLDMVQNMAVSLKRIRTK